MIYVSTPNGGGGRGLRTSCDFTVIRYRAGYIYYRECSNFAPARELSARMAIFVVVDRHSLPYHA